MSESHPGRPPRVLSCVLCQQRKVRCARTFPCPNCIKANAQCVPAGLLPRRRKRRLPERELLDRLHQYENLLSRNNIEFKPLRGEPPNEGDDIQTPQSVDPEYRELPSPSSSSRLGSSAGPYEAKYILPEPYQLPRRWLISGRDLWDAMDQASREPDEDNNPHAALTEEVVKNAWAQGAATDDPLFGGQNIPVDLSSLHPETSQIFRLWQIYLDNVDPLLKVTHTPTLQGRIVEAAANLKNVNPVLEALMFGIYCIAILSLMSDHCEALLGSSRDEALARYQGSCRQALVHCEFLRSDDRDCLTALYFYLISLRPTVGDPRALASMLGIAIRTAQRMGLHSESACARYPPSEAEMRRRLWWSLVLFDSRIGELADHRTSTLNPLWDCRVPINVNDFDLRPEMKDVPKVQSQSSEALFVVARCEMGDFQRNSSFHLDFTCPPLKAIARKVEWDAVERVLEERYLRFCNPENPLHFMTIWMTRGWLAKSRLFECYSQNLAGRQTNSQRDSAISHALAMVDCDTKMTSNASVTRYLWFVHMYFPFPAYIHILQDLRRRPLDKQAERCWIALGNNFEARASLLRRMSRRPLFQALTGIVFQVWEATESALRLSGQPAPPPKIICIMKDLFAQNTVEVQTQNPPDATTLSGHPAPWSTQMGLGLPNSLPVTGRDTVFAGPETWAPFDLSTQISGGSVLTASDWSLINWGMM